MKKILFILLVAVTLNAGGKIDLPVIVPTVESVENSSWYVGAGVVWAKFQACNIGPHCHYEDVTYGTIIRGGYDFNPYIGLELRGIRTFLDKGPYGGVPLEHIGLFVKPQYPIYESINIYALIGYGYSKNMGNGGRLNYLENESGFSAGAGFEYDLGMQEGSWRLFLDYQRLLIKSDVPDIDVISLGLRYDFQ